MCAVNLFKCLIEEETSCLIPTPFICSNKSIMVNLIYHYTEKGLSRVVVLLSMLLQLENSLSALTYYCRTFFGLSVAPVLHYSLAGFLFSGHTSEI